MINFTYVYNYIYIYTYKFTQCRDAYEQRCAIGAQLDAGPEREMLWRCTVPRSQRSTLGGFKYPTTLIAVEDHDQINLYKSSINIWIYMDLYDKWVL